MSPKLSRRPTTVIPGMAVDRGYVTINGVCPWCKKKICRCTQKREWTIFHKDRKMATIHAENWMEAVALARKVTTKQKKSRDGWYVTSDEGGGSWPLVHTPQMVRAIETYIREKFIEDMERDLSLPEEEQNRRLKELTKQILEGEIP